MPQWPHRSDAFCYGSRHHAVYALAFYACLLMLLAGNVLRAAAASGILTAQVSSATVPAGGTAQVRISLASPQALVSGEVVMDLDPTVFGDIAAADVFSATGDQLGMVSIQGRHLDAQFTSVTGGLGRLPGVPILAVSVPILPNAPTGAVSVSFRYGSAPWKDVQGRQYVINALPGTLTIGGSLSVEDVVPGGGLVPAGTVVRIDGTGFTSQSALQIDGVSVAATQFVSPQEITFTLGAPADLTGKRLLLTNPDGSQVDHFSSLRGAFVTRPTSGPLATVQPIFPLQTYAAANAGSFMFSDAVVALENQTLQPVDVIFKAVAVYENDVSVQSTTVTLPPGGIYVKAGSDLGGGNDRAHLEVLPAVPIRMVTADPAAGPFLMTPIPVPVAQVDVFLDSSVQDFSTANPLSLDFQIGTSAPAPTKLVAQLDDAPTPFTVSATSASGGLWLAVSPVQGTTCNNFFGFSCPDSSKFTASVDPSKLRAGVYHGTITVTPGGFNPQPTVIPVVVTASALPTISATWSGTSFYTPSIGVAPSAATIKITSNGGPAAFSLSASTQSGRNWISAAPTHGTTPATLTATADQTLLNGSYDYGTITITGPRNTLKIFAELTVGASPQVLTPSPASLQFFAQAGHPAPPTQGIDIGPVFDPFTISFRTADGANWLKPVIHESPGVPRINVSVDSTGLAPATYQGTITINSAAAAGPATVPVTLTVWTGPPPAVIVTPSSLTFTSPSGSVTSSQTLNIATGKLQLDYAISNSTADGGGWLIVMPASRDFSGTPSPTPTTASVTADATNLDTGTYHGTITITAPLGSTNSTTVPVTFTVTAAPPPPPPLPQAGPPLAVAIVSAASQNAGSVAPGEIFTIFGQNIGPAVPVGFTLDANGKVASNLNGARVLFNGVAAPLVYASATQVNGIVPYEVAGQAVVRLEAELNGARTTAAGLPVATAAPALFALDSTGVGRAAVLNQDNSVNGPSNPAARGSIVQIFATGEGLTAPRGITGGITGSDTKKPVLPVAVSIGGVDAFITYDGSAPDAVAGLFQVNAVVPAGVTPGPAIPIILIVGTLQSQTGVTIAIK